jgi:hypothetical protein
MKRFKYLFLYLFALIGLGLIWFIFIKLDFISVTSQKTTFIIAALGLLFSITQFIYTNLRHKENVVYQIRYQEYNKLISLFNSYTNSMNDCMQKDYNPNEIVNRLMNIQNEIAVLINTTSNWIFPNLKLTAESKSLSELTSEILIRTSKFGKDYNSILKNFSEPNAYSPLIEIERMNWHNSVRESLKGIHNVKYQLFTLIQDYLKE